MEIRDQPVLKHRLLTNQYSIDNGVTVLIEDQAELGAEREREGEREREREREGERGAHIKVKTFRDRQPR